MLVNSPSEEVALLDNLREKYAAIVNRQAELLGFDFSADIKSSTDAERVTDFAKLISACEKSIEASRKVEKDPYLNAGRVVDGFFKSLSSPLEEAAKKLKAAMAAWTRKLAEEERKRREAEAEAERARVAELARQEEEVFGQAIAEPVVPQAIEIEAVKPIVRGSYGGMASTRKSWTFNPDFNRADLDWGTLLPYLEQEAIEKAIRAFIKAGGRELKGVNIYEAEQVIFR